MVSHTHPTILFQMSFRFEKALSAAGGIYGVIMICKYLSRGDLVSINLPFCGINLIEEIFVPDRFHFNQINIPLQQVFKGILEVEIVVKIIILDRGLEHYKKVNVAIFVKSVSYGRTENMQTIDIVLDAQCVYRINMTVYAGHKANIWNFF